MILDTEHVAYLRRHWKVAEAHLNMAMLKLVLSCSS